MAKKQKQKLKIIPLGGIGEIGKNITVVEFDDQMIVVDCGLGFPDDDMLGIDLVIPDTTYLEKNADKIKAILITHGHEDHIGGIPYLLKTVNAPIYATKLALGILENKLVEHHLEKVADTHCISAGDTVKLGAFSAEAIRVNHSIADSVAWAITTPVGIVVFSGDFKIDVTPIDGEMTDLTRFGELGKKGVLAFCCESTNAERAGYTPSERIVGNSLDTQNRRSRGSKIHLRFDHVKVNDRIHRACLRRENIRHFIKRNVTDGSKHFADRRKVTRHVFSAGNGSRKRSQRRIHFRHFFSESVSGKHGLVCAEGGREDCIGACLKITGLHRFDNVGILENPLFRAYARRHARLDQCRSRRTIEDHGKRKRKFGIKCIEIHRKHPF
jgi:hypothetical protein